MTKAFKTRLVILLSVLIFVIGACVTAFVVFAEDYYTIRIEYKYTNDSIAHDPYVAILAENTEVDLTVTNPIIPGYKPVTSLDESEAESASTTLLNFTLTENHDITIYYVPDLVHYKVRYFKQNIRDDLYTEDLGLDNDMYERTGYTGEYPEELERVKFDGFTSLFHEPDCIAADGSTVFKLYYDRNYYLIDFDLGEGGYGVEPVYAKHGSTYNIGTPKRKGYEFLGWCKADADGNYVDSKGNIITDEKDIESATENFTSGTVPIGDSYFKAVWEPKTSRYSIVYWIENPDSTLTQEQMEAQTSSSALRTLVTANYSVIVAKDFEDVPSNTIVHYDEMIEDHDFFYTNVENKTNRNLHTEFPTMSTAQLEELNGKGRYFTPNSYLTKLNFDSNLTKSDDLKLQIAGDGTTRINVYYSRKEYTLKFFYARQGFTKGEIDANKISLTNSTKSFSKSPYKNINGKDEGYMYAVSRGDWKQNCADSLPHLKDKYTSPSSPDYIAGLEEKYEDYTAPDKSKYRFWYYEVKAKYNGSLKNKWLVDAVTDVHRKGAADKEMCKPGSWAVEYYTDFYSSHTGVGNFTVKGFYERLSHELMFKGSDYDDNTELHYLVSWTNTGDSGWNYGINRVLNFKYENYTELLPKETAACEADPVHGPVSVKVSGGYSNVRQFTTVSDGVSTTKWYGLKSNQIIETIDSGDQYDRNKSQSVKNLNIRLNQTAAEIKGFKIENYRTYTGNAQVDGVSVDAKYKGQIILDDTNTEIDWSEDTDNDRHATVRFFYRRLVYTLKFRNENIVDREFSQTEGNGVAYGVSLNKTDENGDYIYKYEPEFLDADLKDYYVFDAWYYTPYYYRKVDFSTATMPADDMTLYAHWKPITKTVTFYNDFRAYSRKNELHSCDVDYNTKIFTYDVPTTQLNTVTNPETGEEESFKLETPSARAQFAGWYYIDSRTRQPVRFDPESIPVTQKLSLYAEWVSQDTAKYKITYTDKETGEQVAPPTTGTVFVSKTKTFTAKGSSELDAEHRYSSERANWWPTVSSHSVLVEENRDGYEYEPNTYNFEYIQKDNVYYEVRYIDGNTGLDLLPPKTEHTNLAAVTETARHIEHYVPSRLTQSVVLAASLEEDDEKAMEEEVKMNTITFVYSESDTGTIYQINHYVQNVDDMSSYNLYYSETKLATIGDVVTVANHYNTATSRELSGAGYSLNRSATTVVIENEQSGRGTPATVTLTGDPMIISIYYDRNYYNYTVKYYDYEAEYKSAAKRAAWDGMLEEIRYWSDDPEVPGVEPVGKTVDIVAPSEYTYTYVENGVEKTSHYTRISDRELSLVIRPDTEEPSTNVIKVYYKKDSQRTLTYQITCDVETEDVFASLSQSKEIVENEDEIRGCTVTPRNVDELNEEYEFLGWFNSPEPLDANRLTAADVYTYTPSLPGADMTYYAVFKQKVVSMTVDIMYNDSGVYSGEGSAEIDSTGDMTGYRVRFDAPMDYVSGTDTPLKKNNNFTFWINRFDSRLYKYEFAGWYEVDESDVHIYHHEDKVTARISEERNKSYHYIAMFKKKALVDSVSSEIRFRFNTRTNGTKDYVIRNTFVRGAELNSLESVLDSSAGAYELPDSYILALAPFESNHGETLKWSDEQIVKTSDEDAQTMTTIVTAKQEVQKVVVNYRLDADGVFESFETAIGANVNTDPQLAKIDASDKDDFSYWEIRKSADGDVIAKCYDARFTFCIMDEYYITPVFNGKTTAADDPDFNDVRLRRLDYSRNRWTDDEAAPTSGSADLLYCDFEISFNNKQERIAGSEDYQTGVVFELCATLPADKTFDSDKDYNIVSDEANLKAAVKSNASAYEYKSGKSRSIQITDIPTSELTNKNRVEFGKAYVNNYTVDGSGNKTYKNARYLVKITAYLRDKGANDVFDEDDNIKFSNSVYICLSDIAVQELAPDSMKETAPI